MRVYKICYLLCLSLLAISCGQKEKGVFRLLDASETGIDFSNEIKNNENFNIFNYRNFYNGGGVSVGDINNDGLADIFFTANMGPNKLYLNKGNFKFEDITEKAGVAEAQKWSTGAVMVDINADGLLDIYVCNAGYQKNIGQENALFINNGDNTFTNKAKEYGLDDNGYSTHAAFFDYDLDGDLDAYMLNNSFIPVNTLNYANNRDLRAKDWPVKDFLKGGGDKLLRNDKGKFIDVSEEAGIYGSLIGFGLGITLGDINADNYPDIYVSNDFFEKDYLYINQQNGTFKEELESRMAHTSLASMGADMADINNDGFQEIFVTDMLPITEERLKTTTAFENHYAFNLKVEKGFYKQFMQNTLQLNNGDGTYSEIANFAGVNASDWSWGALMFDADNDRKNDIYVSNGILHDVIDQDFIDFFANEISQKMALSGKKTGMQTILDHIPSKPQPNVFFHNKGKMKFEEAGKAFGFDINSFSNGAAYADLDNDGNLDLVVNNVNQAAFIYKNENPVKNHFIKIKLKGEGQNTFAIGANVKLYIGQEILSKQLTPSRGFQSSTEYPMTIGLGDAKKIDSLEIIWPNGKSSNLKNIPADQTLEFEQSKASETPKSKNTQPKTVFIKAEIALPKHTENEYEDFFDERNIPLKLSSEGPALAVGDLNGDGLDDVFLGGAKGQLSKVLIQQNNGFIEKSQAVFAEFIDFEDTASSLFDADGDGDLDLYIGSGGNEFKPGKRELRDRLFLNDGNGNFSISADALPSNGQNTSIISPYDFDGDGDLDLFVGSRSVSKVYGQSADSYLLQNDGHGKFRDVSQKVAPQLKQIGMVRNASWTDLDNDKKPELVIVGDWMPVITLTYKNGTFNSLINELSDLYGFWGGLKIVDVNNDGFQDLIIGNIGDNFVLHPDSLHPLKLWLNDFDSNGTVDKMMTKTYNNLDVPVFLKRDITEQFPALKNRNLKHSEYAKNSIVDLFDNNILSKSEVKEVNYTNHILALGQGNGHFNISKLPYAVQISCINSIESADLNGDQLPDLIMAGNFQQFAPQFGALDACYGNVLINKGNGVFENLKSVHSGLKVRGEVKGILPIKMPSGEAFILGINNQSLVIFFKQ